MKFCMVTQKYIFYILSTAFFEKQCGFAVIHFITLMTCFKMTSKHRKNRKKMFYSKVLQLWKNGVDKMYILHFSLFLPNIGAWQPHSWQKFVSLECNHFQVFMLVSMATVDSGNEMSCLGHSVCGNRSVQYKELYLICLDKNLDFTG